MPIFSSKVELSSASLAAGTELADNRYIKGAFKSYNDVAAYDADSIDRFTTGQIIYITSSQELYEVTVHPADFITLFQPSKSIASFEFPADTGSFLVTASVNQNVITLEKGDGSSFDLIVDTGSGGGGAGFPFTGDAVISGSLEIEKTSGYNIKDLFLISGDDDEGKVSVNQEGVLNLQWSGSAPPTAIEGGLYYSSSAFYIGI